MSRDLFSPFPRLRRLIYASAFTIVPLIPLALARFGAYHIGILFWWCDARGRRVVTHNLQPTLPQASKQAVARTVRHAYISCCYSIAENLHIHQLPARMASGHGCDIIDPWHVLDESPMAGPRILVTHHSNFELMPALLHHRGHIESMDVISLSHEDPHIDEMFDRSRRASGVTSLLLDAAPLASLRALNDGHILGIVGDRDYSGNGRPMPVCGRQLAIPSGPAALAVQSGAPIIPMFCARQSPSSFMVCVGRPLHADSSQPKRADIDRLCHQLAHWYERCIQAAPSQWLAFHHVWHDQHRQALDEV